MLRRMHFLKPVESALVTALYYIAIRKFSQISTQMLMLIFVVVLV